MLQQSHVCKESYQVLNIKAKNDLSNAHFWRTLVLRLGFSALGLRPRLVRFISNRQDQRLKGDKISCCLYVPMWKKKPGGCLYKLTCCNKKSDLLFKYKLYLWINFIYHSKALEWNFLSYSHWPYGCRYVSFGYVPLQMLSIVPCCDALTCGLVNTKAFQ